MHFRAMDAAESPARDLIEAMVESLVPLYGRIDGDEAPAGGPEVFRAEDGGAFLVGFDDEDADGTRPLCGGGLKPLGDGVVEIKRMYVVPEARGRGVARALLVALEERARALGYERVRLDTGVHQPHAEALYRSAGYTDIDNYNDNPYASYFGEKVL